MVTPTSLSSCPTYSPNMSSDIVRLSVSTNRLVSLLSISSFGTSIPVTRNKTRSGGEVRGRSCVSFCRRVLPGAENDVDRTGGQWRRSRTTLDSGHGLQLELGSSSRLRKRRTGLDLFQEVGRFCIEPGGEFLLTPAL